jgi:hypothetical protein
MKKFFWLKKPLALIMFALSFALVGGLVLVGGLALANQPAPGSREDPLVTRGFLDHYLARETANVYNEIHRLKAQVANLEERLARLRAGQAQPVRLTIGEPRAYIGQTAHPLDVAPFLTPQGRTMIPFRFLGEALGAQVEWDQAGQRVTYRLGAREVTLVIGRPTARLNGNPVTLEIAPQLVSGRTMVPLRAVGELLGARFEWQAATQTVIFFP